MMPPILGFGLVPMRRAPIMPPIAELLTNFNATTTEPIIRQYISLQREEAGLNVNTGSGIYK